MAPGLNDFLRAAAIMPPPGPRAPAIFGLQLDLALLKSSFMYSVLLFLRFSMFKSN